jgi:ABC-type uncharacterized transport system permease subunit
MSGSVTLLGLTVVIYLVGAVLLGANLFLRRPTINTAGRLFAILGVLLHMGAIGMRCAELKRAPFVTPGESLSLLAWIVALVYIGVDIRGRLAAAGPFALGLSFLLVLLAAVLPASAPIAGQNAALLASNAISLHIIATVGAIALFALAFCCAALYLTAHHILKSKNGLAWMKRLPPLTTVESSAFTLAAIGFPLLTLGILAGFIRAASGGLTANWMTDPKAILSYVVWAVYGAYLLTRLTLNWPPLRTSYILIAGLFLSVLLFLAPTSVHRFP